MAVSSYIVKNKRNSEGLKTGKSGKMYIVKFQYRIDGKLYNYSKRGFATKLDASKHEMEIRKKLENPAYSIKEEKMGEMYLKNYLDYWLSEIVRDRKNRTIEGYVSHIEGSIKPKIGKIKLKQITPKFLDEFLRKEMEEDGLAVNTVRNHKNILSSALKAAALYGYIEENPVSRILTSFSANSANKAEPYNAVELKELLRRIEDRNEENYEFFTVLTGLYGLRESEALGLKWEQINWGKRIFVVDREVATAKAFRATGETEDTTKTLSSNRALPITKDTFKYFKRQYLRYCSKKSDENYKDYGLAICRNNGMPYDIKCYSGMYPSMTLRVKMRRLTIQGLRRSTATNLHSITEDLYTISSILGHSIKSTVQESNNIKVSTVTYGYIDISLKKKEMILERYHNMVFDREKSKKRGNEDRIVSAQR